MQCRCNVSKTQCAVLDCLRNALSRGEGLLLDTTVGESETRACMHKNSQLSHARTRMYSHSRSKRSARTRTRDR
jgi:hypothetical protein